MATDSGPADRPPGADAAITIPDNLMIFRSNEGQLPSCSEKKKMIRLTRSKIKLRRSTPAPPAKENGRKRVIYSPAPEDKQLRKKLDFGEEGDGRNGQGPRRRTKIFPAAPSNERDQPCVVDGLSSNHSLELVIYEPAPAMPGPPSGEVTDQVGKPASTPTVMHQVQGEDVTHSDSNVEKLADFGSLPNMGEETKLLLERGELTNHMEVSHSYLAVETPLVEKRDDLLSLARHDVADELDQLVAQPLLAGGRIVGNQVTAETCIRPPPETDDMMMNRLAPVDHMDERTTSNLSLPGRASSVHARTPPKMPESGATGVCEADGKLADTDR